MSFIFDVPALIEEHKKFAVVKLRNSSLKVKEMLGFYFSHEIERRGKPDIKTFSTLISDYLTRRFFLSLLVSTITIYIHLGRRYLFLTFPDKFI